MMTFYIILINLILFAIGLIIVFRRVQENVKCIEFTLMYRDKFVDFTNKYFDNAKQFSQGNNFDSDLYIWLTKNVNRMQDDLGFYGFMDYTSRFQGIRIPHYSIVINTMPKFRDGTIDQFDVNATDDCLLRFLGTLEESRIEILTSLKNPFIWYREGVRTLISLPLKLINWFGIFNTATLNKITGSMFYKLISGIVAFITFLGTLVTIFAGYDQTILLLKKIVDNSLIK